MESQEQNPGKATAETGVGPAQAGAKSQPEPKLLEQVRNVMRLHHYSIHTERSYLDWIKRYVQFQKTWRMLSSNVRFGLCFCGCLPHDGQQLGNWYLELSPYPLGK